MRLCASSFQGLAVQKKSSAGDGDGDARDAYDDAHGQTKSDVDAVRSHGDDDDLRNEGSWSMNH